MRSIDGGALRRADHAQQVPIRDARQVWSRYYLLACMRRVSPAPGADVYRLIQAPASS